MKIVHALGWYFPESVGGTAGYVNGLAQRQRRFGHCVAVTAPQRMMGENRAYEHEGVPVFRYELRGEQPTRDECQARVPANGGEILLNWLRRERPDLLHVHTLTPSLNVLEFESIRALGIRLVLTNHMPSLGYLCHRGTLMRWDQVPCDGQVRTLRCSACCLNAAG